MIGFVGTLVILFALTIIIQLISKMKIVGGNELGIKSGQKWKPKGFSTVSGGRVFVIPLFNKFAKIDLTPHTIEVVVESAIAAGIVPLDVKATVSFAIASNEAGRSRAVTRILEMTQDKNELRKVASSIIEGHLRDAIASMTPEQVMQDKDALVARMINVCKEDLENIGIEITTMNIADVDDRRLTGVDEPDLYIALLKRIQTANAETQARVAQAESHAAAAEAQENRRAEVEVRQYENLYQNLAAETRVKVAEQEQRKAVGVQKALREAQAKVAGLKAEIESEKQRIEMLGQKYEAEIITPALAEQERLVLAAKAESATLLGKAQAEIDQLKLTLEILEKSGQSGVQTYMIENFQRLIEPFAETLSFFPADQVSVFTGIEGEHKPISAIHPNAIAEEKNRLIAGALAGALQKKKRRQKPEPRPSKKQAAPSSDENVTQPDELQDLAIDLSSLHEDEQVEELDAKDVEEVEEYRA
ncbi:band 7 protein [Candidatus Vecturithrix granuli]|uniref:Band 7 protein n=1 Tax=Vecturithrix granuli TaxID=1499967 RepID=A0A081BTU2_VECG1|nr:band 7 protein [Candidatus Vecturithrix granuli]